MGLGSFLKNLFGSAKQNDGTASSNVGSNYNHAAGGDALPWKDKVEDTYANVKEKVVDAFENAKDKAEDTFEDLKETISDTYENAKEKVSEYTDRAESKHDDAAEHSAPLTDTVKETFDDVKEETQNAVESAKNKVNHLAHETAAAPVQPTSHYADDGSTDVNDHDRAESNRVEEDAD